MKSGLWKLFIRCSILVTFVGLVGCGGGVNDDSVPEGKSGLYLQIRFIANDFLLKSRISPNLLPDSEITTAL